MFEEGEAQPIVLRGLPVGRPPGTVGHLLHIIFYQTWEDADEDGTPFPDELTGISTRLDAGEPVNFVAYAFGLKDIKVYMNIIDANGEQLKRNHIPFKEDATYAVRTFLNLEPGVCFFEFFVNNHYLFRVPIQVTPSLDP